MPLLTYIEETGDQSPTGANFSNNGQSCSATYLLSSPSYNNLRASIVDVLGYTSTRTTNGRITRVLPLRHNIYQWMFADSVNYQGVGTFSTQNVTTTGSPLVYAQVPLYGSYHVRVNFSPRNYNSWQDQDISVIDSTFYDKGNNAVAFAYAEEWQRFTEFALTPSTQFLTAQQGDMVFRADGSGGSVDPNLKVFQDSPRIYQPDSVLKVTWSQVPYRYLTSENSYLTRFIGYINQNDFGYRTKGNTLAPYKAGSLLFVGAQPVSIYTPPIPDEGLLSFNFGDGFNRGKLCDLELTFMYTARTIGTATGNTPDMSAVNRNWIVAGWNLYAWLTTRKYYYATTRGPSPDTDQTKWYPTYNSFPFELLFTDPDAPKSPVIDP